MEMTDKTHRGWGYDRGPIDGLSPVPGPNADILYAMGHRPEDGDGLFVTMNACPDADGDLVRACLAQFSRNLLGFPGGKSQYGLEYVPFKHSYPAEVEEHLGTAKARELLQEKMIGELKKLAHTHPVAVWRTWPDIDRNADGVGCYMRLHVMTEAQFQVFAQSK